MSRIIYVGKQALTMTVSSHYHSSLELIFFTSGCGEMFFDDRTLRYSIHDIVIIPPNTIHSSTSTTGFTSINIHMEESTINQLEPFIVHADPNGFLLNAFSAAFHYYSGSPEDRSVLLPLYGQLIAAFLATRDQKPLHSEIVQKMENNILENYPDCNYDFNLFLSTLPFNPEYLKRIFKKETGLTPLQYLTDKRLESAASNLAITLGKGNISDTAYKCGFSEPLYFSRLFKRKYGISPRKYASMLAAAPENLETML